MSCDAISGNLQAISAAVTNVAVPWEADITVGSRRTGPSPATAYYIEVKMCQYVKSIAPPSLGA